LSSKMVLSKLRGTNVSLLKAKCKTRHRRSIDRNISKISIFASSDEAKKFIQKMIRLER
jgi:hypothetical protein